jgi:hypothetical protein
MLLQAFVWLILAIATHYFSRTLTDEAVRIVTTLTSRFCLFLSLILAPWLIKLLILFLLVTPIWTPANQADRF